MKISTQWLNEFIDTPPADELAHIFEMAGIGVEDHNDNLFTLEITSNRGDWLSTIGLAREIAAMTGQPLRVPAAEAYTVEETGQPAYWRTAVEIEDEEGCPRYIARYIDNVRLGPSPDWMQQRLIECGMRPINNIVDVTNYVMLEMGHPLHAFDATKVERGRIIVRRAHEGEKITTLDGVERALNEEVLLITDPNGPIAIAGIMGGQDTEVTEETTKVLLEAAHFDPVRVRRGVRQLGLSSEASRRFERWVNPNTVLQASNRAAQLLRECAGGVVAVGAIDRYPTKVGDGVARMRFERCNDVLGLDLSGTTMMQLLQRLGLQIISSIGTECKVGIPTWRRDIEREIDLIEEVARMHGYENIPLTLHTGVNTAAGLALSQRLEERAKSALLRCGLNEVVTYSLQSEADVQRAGLTDTSDHVVKLRNPLSEDYTQLRTSLLPSLLQVLQRNVRRRARIFEFGRVYLARPEQQLPDERRHIGIALLDAPPAPHWQKQPEPIDFFTLKAIVNRLLDALGAPPPVYQAVQQPSFHPGRCAALMIDSQQVGVLGEVHPDVAARYELGARAYIATIDFDDLVRHISLIRTYTPITRFPAAERDLALVVRSDVPAATVESVVRAAGGPLLESAQVFDVYTGPPIPPEFKSLAFALRFRAPERTLTDVEVDAAMQEIIAAAERELEARLRA